VKTLKRAVLCAALLAPVVTVWAGKWSDEFKKGFWYLAQKQESVNFVTVQLTPKVRTRFLCAVYTLANDTKAQIKARPNLVVLAEVGDKKRKVYYDCADAQAKAEIEKLKDATYLTEDAAAGKFEPGKAKKIVSIFPQPDLRAKYIVMQFRGLTDQFKVVTKDGKKSILKRVYEMRYHWPGDDMSVGARELRLVDKKWAWRAIEPRILTMKLVEEP